MGTISNIVKQYVPASFKAMVGATNAYYSQIDLQALTDFTKFRIFSTVVAEASEAGAYNLKEQRLLGVLTTLQFIPAAIDFWGDQLSSESAGSIGQEKNVGYFDHRPDLWKVFDRLSVTAQELSTELGINLNIARAVIPKVSYGDNGRELLLTSDPQDFEAAFDEKAEEAIIAWSALT